MTVFNQKKQLFNRCVAHLQNGSFEDRDEWLLQSNTFGPKFRQKMKQLSTIPDARADMEENENLQRIFLDNMRQSPGVRTFNELRYAVQQWLKGTHKHAWNRAGPHIPVEHADDPVRHHTRDLLLSINRHGMLPIKWSLPPNLAMPKRNGKGNGHEGLGALCARDARSHLSGIMHLSHAYALYCMLQQRSPFAFILSSVEKESARMSAPLHMVEKTPGVGNGTNSMVIRANGHTFRRLMTPRLKDLKDMKRLFSNVNIQELAHVTIISSERCDGADILSQVDSALQAIKRI